MIRNWRHKGLRELFETGRSAKVTAALQKRVLIRLDVLDAMVSLQQLNQPGFNFHRLHGRPVRYTIHVNGPWCIIFGLNGTDVIDVDLEQYH